MEIWAWSTYQTNAIEVKQDSYMLSFSMKWLGERRVHTFALPDYPNFKRDKTDDSALVKEMWRAMDGADIIIAQNGDNFDLKVANTRFLVHGLPPPAACRSVDTLKWARKLFKFASNRQDNITRQLGLKRKLAHTGKHLWLACGKEASYATNLRAFKKMAQYNARDVIGLEQMYLRMRPFATNHPNLNLYHDGPARCPTCQSDDFKRKGFRYLKSTVRQAYVCNSCGAQWQGEMVKNETSIRQANPPPSNRRRPARQAAARRANPASTAKAKTQVRKKARA